MHYWYTTKEEFEKGIKEGRFLEYAHVHSNIYGTSFQVSVDIISAQYLSPNVHAQVDTCCVLPP